MQLSRYSKSTEQRFRMQFENSFDYLSFNKELVLENGSGHYTIAFDPSYINKSDKQTHGVGWYWSGVAGTTKWGLEIAGIGAIDIENHTGFHLDSVQTPNDLEPGNLLEHYSNVIIQRKDTLQQISKYVVADAYFSKGSFVNTLCDNNFEVVSRFRSDADLKYLFKGEQKKGRGRPKKYNGIVDYKNIDMDYFSVVQHSESSRIFSAIVYSKALKRNIKLVIVFSKKKKEWTHKLYFSIDLNLTSEMLLKYYQYRFQIEFIYRDAKQFSGLHDCQARSENKLKSHFNLSLSTINIAKITHWLCIPKNERPAFSMADIKTMYYNQLLLNRFFSVFGISAHIAKNNKKIRELITYGTIAS